MHRIIYVYRLHGTRGLLNSTEASLARSRGQIARYNTNDWASLQIYQNRTEALIFCPNFYLGETLLIYAAVSLSNVCRLRLCKHTPTKKITFQKCNFSILTISAISAQIAIQRPLRSKRSNFVTLFTHLYILAIFVSCIYIT